MVGRPPTEPFQPLQPNDVPFMKLAALDCTRRPMFSRTRRPGFWLTGRLAVCRCYHGFPGHCPRDSSGPRDIASLACLGRRLVEGRGTRGQFHWPEGRRQTPMSAQSGRIDPPPGGDEPLFRARGLSKTYQMGEVEIQALRGVDLDLYAGIRRDPRALRQREIDAAQYPRWPRYSQRRISPLSRA